MNHSAPESGLATLLASRGRGDDTMLIHMTPGEVQGLQRLAVAHGGSLTINPQTGLYEANILKKILPMVIGAAVPSIPGLGSFAKTIGFGNTALGTSLLVGGASALIEGDLKKGLEAGLGAYSGANISESLKAASVAAAPTKLSAEQLRELPRAEGAARELVGATEVSPLQSVPKGSSSVPYRPIDLEARLSNQISSRLPPIDLSPGSGPVAPAAQPSVMGGIKSLFTSPESRTAFGEALGGGFKSPFMQNMSKNLTFMGALNAMTPEPPKVPTGGAMNEDYVYIPGGFNPLYGTGRDQPYQLPGKYYKRTAKGLVPFDPFAMAPGTRGFADGGQVGVAPPKNTPFAEPALDPNVAATRAYIEDLNRRAKNPETFTYPGMGSTGLGGINEPYVPGPSTGGGSISSGSLTGSSVGDLAASMVGQHYINKGIDKGIGYLKDKFTTGDRAEIGSRPVEVTRVPDPPAGLGSFVNRPLIDPLAGTDVASIPTKPVADISSLYNVPNINTGVAAATASIPSSAAGIGSLATRSLIDPLAGIDVASMPVNPVADLSSLYDVPNINTGVDIAGKILPGVATALGAYNTAKAIEAGKEGRAAFSAAATMPAAAKLLNIGALGGPAGMLAAAAIAAIGASMVTTKEFGDKALENYWKAVDAGRGIGQTPPEELAQGFINFYRTNKNEFPGQAKYGRTGNEDFVYDMTQVINNAVKDGKVSKDVDAATMYEQVVQPWLNTMGSGPKNEDARRIQDFMMTDLINSFMQGKPISNAQVKGDKNFKIVSERPVFAGTPPATTPSSVNPFSEPREIAPNPTPYSPRIIEEEPTSPMPPAAAKVAAPAMTPFSEPRELPPVTTPYSPRIIEEEGALPVTPPPAPKFSMADLGLESEREYIQPMMTPFSEIESEEIPRLRGRGSRQGAGTARFNYGGAVGDDYNFGFAGGGMPGEYQAGGKLLDGPGDGMSDDIPAVIRGKGVQRAALADGEFVIPADVVSHLGNGSTKAGANRLYDMMARVRKARTGKTSQAPAVKTNRLLPA